MTCLHCGKKLGFFSRYKDTPFCSEEHLRTHQDELERALIERLGSKAVAPLRSLSELASVGVSIKPVAAPEEAPRPPIAPKIAPAPPPPVAVQTMQIVAQKQIEAPKEPQFTAPAPLYEEYLFMLPVAAPALKPTLPLIPSSSFAIILKAAYRTPEGSNFVASFGFLPAETEFELESASLLCTAEALTGDLPATFEETSFGEPWVEIPRASPREPVVDFELIGEEISLDYEPAYNSLRHTGLGHRNELEPRIRLRFPYAASQVSSAWSELPEAHEAMEFTCGSDWDPIEPAPAPELQVENPFSSNIELSPSLDVKLSISALIHFNLDAAESEDFGSTLSVFARALGSTAGLTADCDAGNWASRVVLPRAIDGGKLSAGWQFKQSKDRVRPVPFPSLFQLGPVLPPRPESSAG